LCFHIVLFVCLSIKSINLYKFHLYHKQHSCSTNIIIWRKKRNSRSVTAVIYFQCMTRIKATIANLFYVRVCYFVFSSLSLILFWLTRRWKKIKFSIISSLDSIFIDDDGRTKIHYNHYQDFLGNISLEKEEHVKLIWR
jgi:hypothetical protein